MRGDLGCILLLFQDSKRGCGPRTAGGFPRVLPKVAARKWGISPARFVGRMYGGTMWYCIDSIPLDNSGKEIPAPKGAEGRNQPLFQSEKEI